MYYKSLRNDVKLIMILKNGVRMLDLKALSDKIDEFEKIIDYNFKDKRS